VERDPLGSSLIAMDLLGRSPIAPSLLMLGKLALFTCCLFPFVGMLHIGIPLSTSPWLHAAGWVFLSGGLVVLLLALAALGRSTAVGIPERATTLRTRGLYGFSRNPVYLGAFAMCAGSCLMALYPENLLLLLTAVAIHHRIILGGEGFLEQRFGEEWRAYRANVPRYIGRPGNTDYAEKGEA
jgi:protein-S-isoprenylcysteine O-methyltransferase Ste14